MQRKTSVLAVLASGAELLAAFRARVFAQVFEFLALVVGQFEVAPDLRREADRIEDRNVFEELRSLFALLRREDIFRVFGGFLFERADLLKGFRV